MRARRDDRRHAGRRREQLLRRGQAGCCCCRSTARGDIIIVIYYYYAAFNAPRVGHRDDEYQDREVLLCRFPTTVHNTELSLSRTGDTLLVQSIIMSVMRRTHDGLLL